MISRRILAAVAVLCALVAPAHAQKTKAQLATEIGTTFPDNTSGQITPAGVRAYETDVINSIMPTAPVVTGNFACFNGTTGLLQDCGSSPALFRQKWTANTTLYVATTGNDTGNNCLVQASPCATLQYTYDYIAKNVDMSGFTGTIQMLDTGSTTTYTAGLRAAIPTVGQNGPSGLLITGNASAKTRVVVSTTSADAIAASAGGTASQVMFSVTNLKVQTTSSGSGILAEGGGASIVWEGVDFGPCAGNHIVASHGAFLLASGNYTVSGNAVTHLAVGTNAVLAPHGATITFSNSPAFSGAFAAADSGGTLFASGMTFTNGNTVTGTKFTATGGAAILPSLTDTVDYLPGNSPGVVGSAAGGLGGQYNRLQIPGEINLVSANYSVLPYDRTILVDATSGNVTLTLFLVGGTQGGNTVQFHRIDNSGNTVTIAPFAGNAIEQANSGGNFVLPITASVSFRNYDTNWYPVNNDTDWKGNRIPVTKGGTGLIVGTSGGIPYFSSTTTMASSALLTANAIMLGGGAATTPATLASLGTTTTLLHGNAAGAPTFGAVVSADMNITTTSCTNQFVTAISAGGVGTCTTDTLASAQHANQGSTTTLLHGNAGGNPSWAAVALNTDVTNTLPVGNGGTGDTGTAWTSYTPTFACGSGTVTTQTSSGRWKQIGKTYFLSITSTITTLGTCAGNVTLTLPNSSVAQANTGLAIVNNSTYNFVAAGMSAGGTTVLVSAGGAIATGRYDIGGVYEAQ